MSWLPNAPCTLVVIATALAEAVDDREVARRRPFRRECPARNPMRRPAAARRRATVAIAFAGIDQRRTRAQVAGIEQGGDGRRHELWDRRDRGSGLRTRAGSPRRTDGSLRRAACGCRAARSARACRALAASSRHRTTAAADRRRATCDTACTAAPTRSPRSRRGLARSFGPAARCCRELLPRLPRRARPCAAARHRRPPSTRSAAA